MGWEGTGKSTICGHAVASCQAKGGKVVYIDGEHAVDKNYFEALGVDTSQMLIAQPSSGEEGFNIAVEMMQSGEVDLLIIDSDSSLNPKAVLDAPEVLLVRAKEPIAVLEAPDKEASKAPSPNAKLFVPVGKFPSNFIVPLSTDTLPATVKPSSVSVPAMSLSALSAKSLALVMCQSSSLNSSAW